MKAVCTFLAYCSFLFFNEIKRMLVMDNYRLNSQIYLARFCSFQVFVSQKFDLNMLFISVGWISFQSPVSIEKKAT